MDLQLLKNNLSSSPAFIINEDKVIDALQALRLLSEKSGCKVLYSIKSLPLTELLKLAINFVDGFSVSSLFEARLANEIINEKGSIHLTTPGIRPDEINQLTNLCTHISCNSLNQHQNLLKHNKGKASLGLRINPQMSFSDDARYDPCRQFSKLGVDINTVSSIESLEFVKGLHFHTVFKLMDFAPLIKTLTQLEAKAGKQISKLEWLNFGGGYFYGQINDKHEFIKLVKHLTNKYGVNVFIEPGYSIVNNAGYLLSTVLDIFQSDGRTIAILDSSINHLPETFEYQRSPLLYEHDPQGAHLAILAGSTCLAGDVFGEYRFKRPLSIGDQVVFTDVGAYSLVKANRFNGYNLPTVYWLNKNNFRKLIQPDYQDYRNLWQSENFSATITTT